MGGLLEAVGASFVLLLATWLASFLVGGIIGFFTGLFS